jgi:hypothetical protein
MQQFGPLEIPWFSAVAAPVESAKDFASICVQHRDMTRKLKLNISLIILQIQAGRTPHG